MISLSDQPIVERFIERQIANGNIPALTTAGREQMLHRFGTALNNIRSIYHTPLQTFAVVLERIPTDKSNGNWDWQGWSKIISSPDALEKHWCKLKDKFDRKIADPTPHSSTPPGERIVRNLADGTAYVIRTEKEIADETYLMQIGKHLINHPQDQWDSLLVALNVPRHKWDAAKEMAPQMPTDEEAKAFFDEIRKRLSGLSTTLDSTTPSA